MNIIDKYNRLRGLLRDGDLVLFHGKGIIANIIQNCDNAYYNQTHKQYKLIKDNKINFTFWIIHAKN